MKTQKPVKLPINHPVAHAPGLDEEHHRQAMAQHRHAVQKRQTFVAPAADAANFKTLTLGPLVNAKGFIMKLLSGSIFPLWFFPAGFRRVLEPDRFRRY